MNINKLIHGPNVAGQSLVDRVMAAKHSLAGQGLAKSVCKATTEELTAPKKKHIDYLVQCTHEPNVSVPQMAGLLLERSENFSWVVVYKSLISAHSLFNYGNERFAQYLASNNCHFKLDSFTDKTCAQGYDMSPFIRRYAKYLNAKFISYRHMAFDFCKIKKGQDGGVLRIMETDALLKTLPVLQLQVDALLEFEVATGDLGNPVIKAGFMMLFKDLIRLLACYNDGIINLLAKFFDMSKKQCREALDIYKKFVLRMEGVEKFFKVAESIGIDKGDIPDLAKAPSSLVDTLEAHIKTMEGTKKGASKSSGATVSAAISNLTAAAATGPGGAAAEDDGGFIFETDTAGSTNPFADDGEDGGDEDLLGLGSDFGGGDNGAATNNPFLDGDDDDADGIGGGASVIVTNDDPWANLGTDTNEFSAFEANFDSNPVIAASPARSPSPSMALFGLDMSKTSALPAATTPELSPSTFMSASSPGASPSHNPTGQVPRPASKQKLIQGDLDTSLALLAGNLDIKSSSQTKKNDLAWNGTEEKKLTGTTNSSSGAGWASNLGGSSPLTSPQHAPALSPSRAAPPSAPVDDDPFADLL